MAQEFDLDRDAITADETPSLPEPPAVVPAEPEEDEETRRCREADEWKQKGNAHYVLKHYEEALTCYASALDACPGSSEPIAPPPRVVEEGSGAAADADAAMEAPATVDATTNGIHGLSVAEKGENEQSSDKVESLSDRGEDDTAEVATYAKFAEKRAVFHCNAAASLQQLGRDEEAAGECSIALVLWPAYVKCFMRRGQAYEKMERWGDAAKDMEAVLALEPNSKLAKDRKARCDALEAERLEKLKVETMAKLKDLGNSVLGNFGLSTDNFKFEQDPGTGSYNMQFVQNP